MKGQREPLIAPGDGEGKATLTINASSSSGGGAKKFADEVVTPSGVSSSVTAGDKAAEEVRG